MKLKGQFSGQEIERAMKHIFRGTSIKYARSKEHWKTFTKLYLGLAWREQSMLENECDLNSCFNNYETKELAPTMDQLPLKVDSFNTRQITLNENDHKDKSAVLKSALPELLQKTTRLFQSKIETLNGSPLSRRWQMALRNHPPLSDIELQIIESLSGHHQKRISYSSVNKTDSEDKIRVDQEAGVIK